MQYHLDVVPLHYSTAVHLAISRQLHVAQITPPPQLSPERTEPYIEYLISIGRLDEAATKLAEIVNDVSTPYSACLK